MTKIIILILLVTILIWWLSGYSKKRSIEPKKNRWHAWGPFSQVWGFIDGDKKRLLPAPMPWPFRKVFTSLTYNQFVNDGNLEAHTGTSLDDKTISYAKAVEILGVKKPIRSVTEDVTRLRKTEIHPYIIETVIPKIGGTFFLVFTVTAKLINPMKVLDLDEFLIFIGNQLNDRVYPWAADLGQIISAKNPGVSEEKLKELIIDEVIGLKIDDDDSIKFIVNGATTNLKKHMGNVVKSYGMKILDFSLDVGYDKKIESILNLRNEQILEVEKNNKEIKASITRGTVRAREKADELQLIELDKTELDDVTIPEMKAQASANKKSNAAWKVGTLALGDTKTSLILPQSRRRQKGGAHANT